MRAAALPWLALGSGLVLYALLAEPPAPEAGLLDGLSALTVLITVAAHDHGARWALQRTQAASTGGDQEEAVTGLVNESRLGGCLAEALEHARRNGTLVGGGFRSSGASGSGLGGGERCQYEPGAARGHAPSASVPEADGHGRPCRAR